MRKIITLVLLAATATYAADNKLCKRPNATRAAVRTECRLTENLVTLTGETIPDPVPPAAQAVASDATVAYGASTPIGAFVVDAGTQFVLGTVTVSGPLECSLGRVCPDGFTRCTTEASAVSPLGAIFDYTIILARTVSLSQPTTLAMWCQRPGNGAPGFITAYQPSLIVLPVRLPAGASLNP